MYDILDKLGIGLYAFHDGPKTTVSSIAFRTTLVHAVDHTALRTLQEILKTDGAAAMVAATDARPRAFSLTPWPYQRSAHETHVSTAFLDAVLADIAVNGREEIIAYAGRHHELSTVDWDSPPTSRDNL